MSLELLLDAAKYLEQRQVCEDKESDSNSIAVQDDQENLKTNGTIRRIHKTTDHVIDPPTSYTRPPQRASGPQYLSVDRRCHSVSPNTVYLDARNQEQRIPTHYVSNSLSGIKGTVLVGHTLPPDSLNISSSSSSSDGSLVGTYQSPVITDGLRVVSLDSPGSSLSNDTSPSQLNGILRTEISTAGHSDREDLLDYKDEHMRKRAGSTPSREVHNKLEKNRRAHLKECFETLRKQLPTMDDKKISNQTILKAAQRYIQSMKRKEREYEHEMERLARQKIAYQQQLASLKKELQSKWDHIDFSRILPDSADQNNDKETKSTSSAPENPDYEEHVRSKLQLNNSMENHSVFYPARSMERPDDDQPLDLCTNTTGPTRTRDWVKRSHPYLEERAMNLSSYAKRSPIKRDLKGTPNSTSPVIPGKSNNQVAHISQLVKAGTTISHVPSVAKVITPQTSEQTNGTIPVISHVVPLNNSRISNLQATTISRLPNNSSTTVTAARHLPIVTGNGILPAQIMASGVQLNAGNIVSPSAIQVITPDGYKLLSADIPTNGTKPVAITLAQPDGFEQLGEDGKARSFMVSVNKNGVSTFHLTVPNPARCIPNAVTTPTVPLNLTVAGSNSVEMTQAGSTSLISSYIPVASTNGLTRLVQGMSVVGPLVVSPPQRGVVVPATTKGLKSHSVGTTSVSLVPTHYANSFSNVVNSVVVMGSANRSPTQPNKQ